MWMRMRIEYATATGMIYGIGVDIVHVSRIARLLEGRLRERFLKRAFHPCEISHVNNMEDVANGYRFLASRWAVKEATLKAIGERVLFPEITIVRYQESDPRPRLALHGKAHQIFQQKRIIRSHVSLSHDGDYALAQVILETE